jgi:hypothetical protein
MMIRNGAFWAAIMAMGVFIAIWVMQGFFWAIATLIMVGVVWVCVALAPKRRWLDGVYTMEDEDDPETTYMIEAKHKSVSSSPKGSFIKNRDLYVPKVNKRGAEFISGATSLRKTQQDGTRRIRKNLWGK